MQLIKTLSALAAFAAAAVVAADPKFVLSLNITQTRLTCPGLNLNYLYTDAISYANGSLYFGQITTQLYTEPFIAAFGKGALGWTSYHQVPTGSTLLYAFPNDNKPLGISVPHSGFSVPSGASGSGFGFGPDGYMTYNGENKFIGCEASVPNSYQVYWLGNKSDIVNPPQTCIGPLYLYRTNITVSPQA